MHRPYQILIPLLSLFLVRVDLTDLYPLEISVTLLKVLDGDTVIVTRGGYRFHVRISKIDAPEMKQPYLFTKTSAGADSKKCLENNLSSTKILVLKFEGYDIYRRVLGDVDDVSLKMIKAGCAAIYPYARFESRHQMWTYLRAEVMAKRQKNGFWGRGGILLPKLWRKKNKTINKQIVNRQSRR